MEALKVIIQVSTEAHGMLLDIAGNAFCSRFQVISVGNAFCSRFQVICRQCVLL